MVSDTVSPDASPDSGEALAGIISKHGPVVIDWMGEGLAWRPLDYGAWTPLAASPASLSGGAEEVERAYDDSRPIGSTFWHELDEDQRARFTAFARALHPSPEAPANRQEAGE